MIIAIVHRERLTGVEFPHCPWQGLVAIVIVTLHEYREASLNCVLCVINVIPLGITVSTDGDSAAALVSVATELLLVVVESVLLSSLLLLLLRMRHSSWKASCLLKRMWSFFVRSKKKKIKVL